MPSIRGSPGLALTGQTIELISSSLPAIGSVEAASMFFAELFRASPELAHLLGSREAQQRKLRGMLNWVSGVLNDSDKLSEGLRALGARHLKYSAKLEHFHAVKNAFMQMISVLDQQSIGAEQGGLQGRDTGGEDGIGGPNAPPLDRYQRLLDVGCAWEALLYVFIGEMSPMMLLHDTLGSFHNALSNDLRRAARASRSQARRAPACSSWPPAWPRRRAAAQASASSWTGRSSSCCAQRWRSRRWPSSTSRRTAA